MIEDRNVRETSFPTQLMLWSDTQSALVRGLAHALSNRVGTIAAVSGMLRPDAAPPAVIVGMLRDESDRLEEVLALLRLLGGESADAGEPEPIHLPDVVGPAVALHAQHPELRDVPVTVTPDDGAPPVRARREPLVRTLLVLLTAAKGGGDRASVRWARDGANVVLAVDGAPGDIAVASAVAALGGVEVSATEAGYAVRLPGL